MEKERFEGLFPERYPSIQRWYCVNKERRRQTGTAEKSGGSRGRASPVSFSLSLSVYSVIYKETSGQPQAVASKACWKSCKCAKEWVKNPRRQRASSSSSFSMVVVVGDVPVWLFGRLSRGWGSASEKRNGKGLPVERLWRTLEDLKMKTFRPQSVPSPTRELLSLLLHLLLFLFFFFLFVLSISLDCRTLRNLCRRITPFEWSGTIGGRNAQPQPALMSTDSSRTRKL